ncbi:MAG TPA: dihydrolipoamide acetyltransferase family protein [Streptosporangiaceae bacterium]|nr:dihydrolipoamide acetyltransferase family protein [Streptosporangiaceae bacterium]
MSVLKEFKLPDVGEGLTEADIVRWHVKPGDTIAVNQIIVEIETAKAVVELPSPYEGTVASLLVPEGQTADVGTPIISVQVGTVGGAPPDKPSAEPTVTVDVPAETAAQHAISAADDLVPSPPVEGAVEPGMIGSPAPKAERQAVLVGYGVKLGTTSRRARKTTPRRDGNGSAPPAPPTGTAPAAGATTAATPRSAGDGSGQAAALAKPPVRKMARDLGVDLAGLTGTGPRGSITRDDVQQAAAASQAQPVPAQGLIVRAPAGPPGAREARIAIRGVRKHTAAAMAASAFTAPHVTEFLQIDITETMAATARLRTLPEFADVRVSPLLLVARALIVAAARHPMINSSWDEAAQEIVVKHYVNLGIAAATDRGLVVPNVKDAQAMTLPQLAAALGQLAETARAGKATPADLSGGTITITNVGIFGVDTGTPILSPGEAAILAFGQVKDAPWVIDGQLAVRKVCTLALSFDHRLVDGDLGSAVLRDVGAMLTDPLTMLAWS